MAASEGKVSIEAAHSSMPATSTRQAEVNRKPVSSYVSMIATAILESPGFRLNLSAIYNWIEKRYPYYRGIEAPPGWRNSIRHNLSLNDCFIKVGRCEDGKGNYWSIHPNNITNFKQGDFKQRQPRRRRCKKSDGVGINSRSGGGRHVVIEPSSSHTYTCHIGHTEDEQKAHRLYHAVRSCQYDTSRQCQQVLPGCCRFYSPPEIPWYNQCHSQLPSRSAHLEPQLSYCYGIPVQAGFNHSYGMGSPPVIDSNCSLITRPAFNSFYPASLDS